MVTRNNELERELQDRENKILELDEENQYFQEELHTLQLELEEKGLLGDSMSEDNQDDGGDKKSKISIKGKKMLSMLKKGLNLKKGLKKIGKVGAGLMGKSKDSSQE